MTELKRFLAGIILALPLHCIGTPLILQARGREIAKVRLIGGRTGTLAVINRQAQSMPVLMRDLNELQQLAVGDEPLLLLPVIKFMHGVKVLIMEAVHGVLICPFTEITRRVDNIAIKLKTFSPSMSSYEYLQMCFLLEKSIDKN